MYSQTVWETTYQGGPPAFNPYGAGGSFGHYKMMQKIWKMSETLANGYPSESTQGELSNNYQHDRV